VVETALAKALVLAAEAKRWDVVAQILASASASLTKKCLGDSIL
jgi:hypothetical protein